MAGFVGLAVVVTGGAVMSNAVSIRKAQSTKILLSEVPSADESTLGEMRDYYEDQTRCPQIGYEQSLLEKWPNLPKIVAGIKFALAKNEGWENDPNTTATRKKLLAVLEDSNFTIKYSDSPRGTATKASIKELLERTARNEEFASGQPLDGNTLQLGPTSDFNRYKDIPDPNDPSKFLVKQEDTGLAVSIIHELVHITQLREDPTLTNIHGGGIQPTTSLSWHHRSPLSKLVTTSSTLRAIAKRRTRVRWVNWVCSAQQPST